MSTPGRPILRAVSGEPMPASSPATYTLSALDGYELGGVIGRGGMGEVRLAFDTRLKRHVALKTPAPGDAEAVARLAREAALTARLEHPNIMPVYHAGADARGRPWYAMRLLSGRTLADAIASEPTLEGRLRLVRHVLVAAEAVAYAHERGVFHRDLKPANLIADQHGATVVADWGLACTPEEAAASELGTGTPGYAAPEQLAGQRIDERADVYSLAMTLAEVLTAQPPEATKPLAELRKLQPAAPPELVAIVERGGQPEPTARYANARAFAGDLSAWFDGRRVNAHPYTTTELLARTIRQWRLPLTVGMLGLLAVVVAVGVGWSNTVAERERAEASEREARAATDRERAATAAAFVAQASTAADLDLGQPAEVFAASALARGESPEARGILARFAGRPRADLLSSGPGLPECRRISVAADGQSALCLQKAALALFRLEPRGAFEVARAEFDGQLARMVGTTAFAQDHEGNLHRFNPDGTLTLVGQLASRGFDAGISLRPDRAVFTLQSTSFVLDLGSLQGTILSPCAPAVVEVSALDADGNLLVTCNDGRLMRQRGADDYVTLTTLPVAESGVASAFSPLRNGEFLIGTTTGSLFRISPQGEVTFTGTTGQHMVYQLAVRGERVLVSSDSGQRMLWELDDNRLHGGVRAMNARAAWVADDRIRFVGDRVEDRRAAPSGRPHLVPLPAGVAALAFSPDGTRLGVSLGSGGALIIDPASGATLHQLGDADVVTKDLTFSPDGRQLALANSRADTHVYDVETGRPLSVYTTPGSRRAHWASIAGILVAPYARRWLQLRTSGEVVNHPDDAFLELEGDSAGHLVGIDAQGSVRLARDAQTITWGTPLKVERANAAAPYEDGVVVGSPERWARYDANHRLVVEGPADFPMDITSHPASALVAIANYDGSATVLDADSGHVLARLVGHRARASAVAFSPDGAWIATGGWDRGVRLWSTDGLRVPAQDLVQSVLSEWGTEAEALLAVEPERRL